MKKGFSILYCAFAALLFLSTSKTIHSQDITVVPSIDIRSEYDDNVSFSAIDETEDAKAVISPKIALNYAKERYFIVSDIIFNIYRYRDESELDRQNQYFVLGGGYQISERWSANANFTYIMDTTLDSYLLETGRVTNREDRKDFRGDFGFSHKMSELANINLDYKFIKSEFDSPRFVDSDGHALSISYNRNLKNLLDYFTANIDYSQRDSQTSDSNIFSLSAGYTHRSSETLKWRGSIGGSYIDLKQQGDTFSRWRTNGLLDLTKTGEISTATIGYRRDFRNTAQGALIEVDRIYFRWRWTILRRLSAVLNAGFYYTQDVNEDTTYFQVSPRVNYDLTENHSLQLGYNYSNSKQELEAERNRIWISINLVFPRKL